MRRNIFLGALLSLTLFPARSDGFSIAGQSILPGKTLDIRFPVPKYFQEYAAQGGNPTPQVGRMVLAFPAGPILIVTSTTDANRTSPMDAKWYERPATAEGWIVLAPDATIKPRQDSTVWRLAMLASALEVIHGEWPGSTKWPVAFGGLSGGAKRSGVLGAMLSTTQQLHICGFFLCGINDDRLSAAYREFHPPSTFLDVPVWLSSGISDPIAPPAKHEHVKLSLQQTGFRQVRVETFDGGHEIKPGEVKRALHWFRQVEKF